MLFRSRLATFALPWLTWASARHSGTPATQESLNSDRKRARVDHPLAGTAGHTMHRQLLTTSECLLSFTTSPSSFSESSDGVNGNLYYKLWGGVSQVMPSSTVAFASSMDDMIATTATEYGTSWSETSWGDLSSVDVTSYGGTSSVAVEVTGGSEADLTNISLFYGPTTNEWALAALEVTCGNYMYIADITSNSIPSRATLSQDPGGLWFDSPGSSSSTSTNRDWLVTLSLQSVYDDDTGPDARSTHFGWDDVVAGTGAHRPAPRRGAAAGRLAAEARRARGRVASEINTSGRDEGAVRRTDHEPRRREDSTPDLRRGRRGVCEGGGLGDGAVAAHCR